MEIYHMAKGIFSSEPQEVSCSVIGLVFRGVDSDRAVVMIPTGLSSCLQCLCEKERR